MALLASRLGRIAYLMACGLVFVFLLAPLLVIVPLSFNAEPYFTFTEGMLRLDAEAFSFRWYRQVATDPVWRRGCSSRRWLRHSSSRRRGCSFSIRR